MKSCPKILEYRRFFAERWSVFLRENYRSPEHVAVCFDVTGRCAQYWWDGVTAPSGHVVAHALLDPGLGKSAAKHLREAA